MILQKNQFLGETVFIVCDGPTILNQDLGFLQDRITWAIPNLLRWPELPFRPTIVGSFEYGTIIKSSRADLVRRAEEYSDYRIYIAGEKNLRSGPIPDPTIWTRIAWAEPATFVHEGIFFGLDDEPDPYSIAKGGGCSILHGGLQPALWYGFRRIFFLGLDMTPLGLNNRLRDAHNEGLLPQTTRAMEVALEKCREAGVEVFNLSPSEHETVFPKMRVEEAREMTQ